MSRQTSTILVCGRDFFFDETVNNCLPCENVCGGNGLNELECFQKCRDYHQNLEQGRFVPESSAGEVSSTMIWPVIAGVSSFLALVTTFSVVLMVFIRRRKTLAARSITGNVERQSLGEAEELLNCSEDSNSPYSTQRGQLGNPALECTPHSCSQWPTVMNEHSSFYSFTPISLVECHNTFTELRSDAFRADEQGDGSSWISLRSDAELTHAANIVNLVSGHQLSGGNESSHVSSIHDMFQMFGWLNKTDWVMDYREDIGGLHIGVDGIGKATAEDVIRKKGLHLPDFQFIVTSPAEGNYIPCPYTEQGLVATGMPTATAPEMLRPGSVIFSRAMEPDLETGKTQAGHAVYSGSLCGCTQYDTGMTVGHLIAHEQQELYLDGSASPIGFCLRKIEKVEHRQLNQITADLALLHLNYPTENTVNFGGRNYRLRLFKGELNTKSPKRIQVMVVRRDGSFFEGLIAESLFTFKKCKLFNTLRIVRSDDNPHRISNEGDSGSLILSRPSSTSDDEFLYVYGMVIGYWVSTDEKHSHTVATRLWNVLETLPSDASCDFSYKNSYTSAMDDSGIFTYVSDQQL